MDTHVELSSLFTNQVTFGSNLEKLIEVSSNAGGKDLDLTSEMGDKLVLIGSQVYADENAERLRYQEMTTVALPTGGVKYRLVKPPKQRV